MEVRLSEILYDETGAGRYLGGDERPISPRTMQRWRLDGMGPPFIKIGRLVRYRKSNLDAFLAARTFVSTAEADQAEIAALP